MKRIAALFLACAVLPMCVRAQAVITEIMYDPPGTDSESGGEWVEIFVTGNENLDLSLFRIGDKTGTSGSFSNRSIVHVLGEGEVSSGEYTIIAKNADQFRSAFPLYAGSLFQSAFSLTDEDTLHLLDENFLVLDDASWTSAKGGKGDGNTLQKVNDDWTNGTPTPGGPFTGGTENENSDESEGDGGTSSHHGPAPVISAPVFRPLIVHIGDDRLTAVGNPLIFEAVFENEPSTGRPEFLWSMGDGTTLKRRSVEYAYRREGVYVIVLTVAYGNQKAVARSEVRVIDPELSLLRDDGVVRIENHSSHEVNLYEWEVESGDEEFIFLGDTILLPEASLTLDPEITRIRDFSKEIELIDPQGKEYTKLSSIESSLGEVAGAGSPKPSSPSTLRTPPPAVAPLKKLSSTEITMPGETSRSASLVVPKPPGPWEKVRNFLGKLF